MLEPIGSSESRSHAALSSLVVNSAGRPSASPATSTARVGRAPTATRQAPPHSAAHTLSTGKSVALLRTHWKLAR